MFYTLLLTQAALISLLAVSARISPKNPRAFFAPVSWFILFYLLTFLIPQLYMPGLGYPLIWTDRNVLFGDIEKILLTQKILCLFLMSFCIGYFLAFPKSAKIKPLMPINRSERTAGLLFYMAGAIATIGIILYLTNPNNPRSDIVSGRAGQILYALSFFMTLGFLIVCAFSIHLKRYLWVVVAAVVFAILLFPLGGRGRVLWPFVSLFAWAAAMGVVKLHLVRMTLVALVLAVILQGMDPLLLYMQEKRTQEAAVEEFVASLEVDQFFFGRTFDAFHNLAIVVNKDEVAHSWRYFFSGSQAAFMWNYFPDVARGGVGFPATLPGGLWLSAGYAGIAFGSFFYGLLFGLIARLYRNQVKKEIDLIVLLMFMPVVANVGTSWLDSYLKMFSLLFPGLLLIYKSRVSLR